MPPSHLLTSLVYFQCYYYFQASFHIPYLKTLDTRQRRRLYNFHLTLNSLSQLTKHKTRYQLTHSLTHHKMRPEHAVDRKPDIVSPIITPTSTFNPNATILELVLKLRSCFQLRDSEEVAAILQSREDKLKQNITDLRNREDKLNSNNIELKNQLQTLNNKYTNVEANRENFVVEKERIEAELRKCKIECDAYRDDKFSAKYELEKVRLDLKMWKEKENVVVERYEKRIAEFEREKKDEIERMRVENLRVREELEKERAKGKEDVSRLKGELAGLIEVKRKAEETSRYWERNYKQCEPRVLKLEKNLSELLTNDPVLVNVVENAAPLLRNPPAINLRSVNNGNPELVDENTHASPGAGSTAESPMAGTNGFAAAGLNSSVMGMASGNRMPTENQAVIEIDDSDDEKPIIETASASKTDKDFGRSYEKDPASQSISRGKRPLVSTQNNVDVGGVDGSIKYKKHKMDSPFPNKAAENSDSSDGSITTKEMEELVSKTVKSKPFNYDVEMLTAFNKDDDLCLNAVCALHRVEKCDKLPRASQYRGFNSIDATRGNQLAKFLVDGDPLGKLRKSVKELQQYDSKGMDECRKLARNHYKQLYQIYQKEEDPFFKEYLVKNYSKKTVS